MDTDPRIIKIDKELSEIRQTIEQQQNTIKNSNLIKKLIEWRKLKQLKQEQQKKQEFRERLKANIEKSSKSRIRKKQLSKSYR